MAQTILEDIKGSELPASWLKIIKGSPDQIFDVTIKSKSESFDQINLTKGQRIAERFRNEGFLTGHSEKVNKLIKEFKDTFSL